MTQPDHSTMFKCPKCGAVGAIFLVKVAGVQVIVKQRCPIHGPRSFKLPVSFLSRQIPFIQDAVYRCYKCGQKATQDRMKMSGPWTLIKCTCPTHGNKLPWQKIDYSVYYKISPESFQAPKST